MTDQPVDCEVGAHLNELPRERAGKWRQCSQFLGRFGWEGGVGVLVAPPPRQGQRPPPHRLQQTREGRRQYLVVTAVGTAIPADTPERDAPFWHLAGTGGRDSPTSRRGWPRPLSGSWRPPSDGHLGVGRGQPCSKRPSLPACQRAPSFLAPGWESDWAFSTASPQ